MFEPHWRERTITANKMRGQVEAIPTWATVAGHREGDNPAAWRGKLKELLPAPSKVARAQNHPALELDDLPGWWAELAKRDGMAARALEFLTMTGARSGEVRGMTWDEIRTAPPANSANSANPVGLWTVQASRTNNGREHRVPLTAEAVALLERLPRMEGSPCVFFALRGGMLSDMTNSAVRKRCTDHTVRLSSTGADRRSGSACGLGRWR
jgi:integrase